MNANLFPCGLGEPLADCCTRCTVRRGHSPSTAASGTDKTWLYVDGAHD